MLPILITDRLSLQAAAGMAAVAFAYEYGCTLYENHGRFRRRRRCCYRCGA
jgi:hypothetical protein